jgi:type II secretory pathway component PulK
VTTRLERGFVLPLVLIVLSLLTLLSMGLSQTAASRMQDLQQRKDFWAFEKQARNNMQLQLYLLLTGDFSQQEVRAGSHRSYLTGQKFEMAGLQVRVQDGAGLFSLAFYQREKFQKLLEKLTDKKTASAISAELGDWIDEDNSRQFHGMEAAGYISRGLAQTPRNGPIRSLEELLQLPSMTRQIFFGSAERPGLRELALAGGADHFNIAAAPAAVLGPMLNLSRAQEIQLSSARDRKNWSQMGDLVNRTDWVFNNTSPFAHGVQYILVYEDGEGARIKSQLMLTPYDPGIPYKLIEWWAPDYGNG